MPRNTYRLNDQTDPFFFQTTSSSRNAFIFQKPNRNFRPATIFQQPSQATKLAALLVIPVKYFEVIRRISALLLPAPIKAVEK